jgi:hypothetical protein
VSSSILHGSEDVSGPHSTVITPFDVDGITLLRDGAELSTDDMLPVLKLSLGH